MDAVFISHVHEDHLDIVQIIRKDRPIELYAVPVVFLYFQFKVACILFRHRIAPLPASINV